MRRRRIIFMVIFVVLGAAAVLICRMTQGSRAWYAPPDSHDPQVAVLADKVENRMLEEVQKVRTESEPWTLRVRESQVNAWLSARLPQWIAHEQHSKWPDQL